MTKSNYKYIIVGAGLSGLNTAHQLQKHGVEDLIILEGRDRIGGRILTKDGIDLGATWFQDHHSHLSSLVGDLAVGKFRQYSKGKGIFIYSTMAPAQYFDGDAGGTSALRISGGSQTLINSLAKSLHDKIKLNSHVTAISELNDRLVIRTNSNQLIADKIVITIPPKMCSTIQFDPPLPETLSSAMANTHTWMSNAIKVGITFKRPFWRDKNLSGTLVGHVGPVIELYDHSDQIEDRFSLMGFVNEGLRDETPENRKEAIIGYIEKHLGPEVRSILSYQEKDWSTDKYTSGEQLKSVYMSPKYGHPIFQEFQMNGKLLFSGAETSPVSGGYMEGAVYSGSNTAEKLLSAG